MRLLLGLTLVLAMACGKADEAKDESKDLADKAKDKAGELGDKAKDKASELGGKARDKAGELGGSLRDKLGEARAAIDGAEDLPGQAIEAVKPYADGASARVESTIAQGKQKADQVRKMAEAVAPMVTDGVLFKPIYQKVDDSEAAALDAAIGDMPRAQVIDGLTVGFRAHSKRQYLVVWRQGDHLVGFVYTSLTDILIEKVIEQTPRLIPLIRSVL